ncbi:hypothetical protein [Dickeya undicola]|uniref:hypothetical protein n=1 Tax=Dickeya undicola TaxID=1577887 RepID=UPI0011CE1B42|nr:hypothetical protein [Dickeya undicola]
MNYIFTRKAFLLVIYVTASLYHNTGFPDREINKTLTQENNNGRIEEKHYTNQQKTNPAHFIKSSYSGNTFNESM